ncbi:MAG: hypothetical protein PVI33_03340 [Candidatus Omnitrophota bacterium]
MIVAIFISLICHIFCFNNLELTFGNHPAERGIEFSKVSFLGAIFEEEDYYAQSALKADYPIDILSVRFFNDMLNTESLPRHQIRVDSKDRYPVNLINKKTAYFEEVPAPSVNRQPSGIMFYPKIPYHFLIYFKDRQIAHMEVAFYISPKGKILSLHRKISSGNPEVDLLIMRNLTHFLNLVKSNFALDSWQTVKIDLSP